MTVLLALLGVAHALPMYAQRSARTCGNCHVSPTWEDEEGWENPELAARKCNMSCMACHTDPTGGGLRNTSGRYFGASTLAMLPTQERSYSDHSRELLSPGTVWGWLQSFRPEPKPGSEDGRSVPSDFDEARAGVGGTQSGNALAYGHAGKPVKMSFWDGRYGSMNADPLVQIGADTRYAYYSGRNQLFPMQMDVHASVHPVHHVTIAATAAGQPFGPSRGNGSVVYARRAYAMIHELPGMTWARAGVFQPAFGTMIDDHTAPTRTLFEVSQAESANTVMGVEVGTAPNYPFAQASVFSNDTSIVGAHADTGWGAAFQGGWRDIQWSLTGHAQIRRRDKLGRGDLMAGGIGWGLSPSFTWKALPVTWLGEVTAGRREVGTRITSPTVGMSELSFLLRNGLIARVRTDVWTESGKPDDLQHRHGLGLMITPIPNVTLDTLGRFLVLPGGETGADVIVHTHIWL